MRGASGDHDRTRPGSRCAASVINAPKSMAIIVWTRTP
jgi:hypothetical protein